MHDGGGHLTCVFLADGAIMNLYISAMFSSAYKPFLLSYCGLLPLAVQQNPLGIEGREGSCLGLF